MTACPFITELSVLISELQTLVALSEPAQVLPLAQRVLGKTEQFDTYMTITKEESILLESHGVNLWNCATTNLLENSSPSDSMNETRATLYHIAHNILSESYRYILKDEIRVLLQLAEMAIFTGSQYTACQQFIHAKNLLELADQFIQQIKQQECKEDQELFSVPYQIDQCLTDLTMAFMELEARQGQWKEVQVYIRKIKDMPEQNADLLFYFCFKVASDLVDKKQWDQALRWTLIFCSSSDNYAQMEEHILTRLAQLICIAIEGKIDNILDVGHTHKLLEIIDNCFKNSRNGFEFHCAKLMILMAGSEPFSSLLEMALFNMMETLDIITDENSQLTQRLGSLLIHLAEKLNVNHLVNGLNLYIQRCMDSHETQESDTIFQHLYLFKFYIFSEWLSLKSNTITQLPQYMDIVKPIMEEMYLVKNRLTNEGFWCCQMILWSVADHFFKNEIYSFALPWYKQIWSFGLTSLKGEVDILVLARKLVTCCIHLGDLGNATAYMETAMVDSGVTIMALDYLLLLETNLMLKETTKVNQCLDLLLHAQGFTTEILMSAAYLCYKNENCELMQKIMDHTFNISHEYKDQGLFNLRLTTILRWTIRLTLNTKFGSDINTTGLLANKDAIVKCMEKAATYFASLTGPMLNKMKEDKEWTLRTGWNLGLLLYGKDQKTEGAMLFAATIKIICLDLHQGTLDDQHLSCLFACLASRLLSSSFNQMNESDRLAICNETISLIKNTSDMKQIGDYDVFVSLVALIQIQCYVILGMFENGLESFKYYSEQLERMANMNTLDVFERVAGIILQCETCPQTVVKAVLKTVPRVLQQYRHLDNVVVEKWAKWNRLYISLEMMDQQNKDDIFNYIAQLCTTLSTPVGIPYPQKEVHYLVIITWNEGMTQCHNSGVNQGALWCRLAHDLLPQLDSSHNALKDQINRAFLYLEKSTET